MRVKRGVTARRRHKKILDQVKGYRQSRSKIYKRAKEAYLHAGQYSTQGRRKRVGQMRSLWIVRLNAALKPKGISYSQFINKLNKGMVGLNRKMLSELAINAPAVFDKVVEKVVA
jgi:large subunit ribosomal protein L20